MYRLGIHENQDEMKKNIPTSLVLPGHIDFEELTHIENEIYKTLQGNVAYLQEKLGIVVRQSIDGIIDTPDTGRRSINDLDKNEKTFIGTRVEIKLRAILKASKGKLDLVLGGHDVDVKFTIKNNWMIPTEAFDEVCIVVAADESRGLLFAGLIKARLQYLNGGDNRDKKKTVSKEGFKNIKWLIAGSTYPASFWKSVPAPAVEKIFAGKSGAGRIAELFTLVQDTPIARSVVADVAQQSDYMKRVRANGGARDLLARKGIEILHGQSDQALIRKLSLPPCGPTEFISTSRKICEARSPAI